MLRRASSPIDVRGRVLIVAYHFPPQAGSSGLLRSLKFCRYLPEFGWAPTVLTIDPRAYVRTDGSQIAEIPADVNVIGPSAWIRSGIFRSADATCAPAPFPIAGSPGLPAPSLRDYAVSGSRTLTSSSRPIRLPPRY